MTTITIAVDKDCYELILKEKQKLEADRISSKFEGRIVSFATALHNLLFKKEAI